MKFRMPSSFITTLILAAIFMVFINMAVCEAQKGSAKEYKQDSSISAYDDDTVLDKKSNLMWAKYDNGTDINWTDAKKYCEQYRLGGYKDWRLPTKDELASLYDTKKSYQTPCGSTVHTTKLIEISCSSLWSSETRGSGETAEAAFFQFSSGKRLWYLQSNPFYGRALPVRSTR